MTLTEAPVPASGRCSEPDTPASTTHWRLARQEPSLSSRNENPLESRRVLTHACTTRESSGASVTRSNSRMVGCILAGKADPGVRQSD